MLIAKLSLVFVVLVGFLYGDAERFRLDHGESRKLVVEGRGLVGVRCRLDLPDGREGWGGHWLGLTLDGKPMPDVVNSSGFVVDLSRIPLHREALRDGDSGLWFVKADSDFVAFNASGGTRCYDLSGFLGGANSMNDLGDFRNSYYDKVFRLDKMVRVVELRNCHPRLSMVCEAFYGDEVSPGLLASQVPVGQGVYPWSFPELGWDGLISARTCIGEFQAIQVMIRNIGDSDVEFKPAVDVEGPFDILLRQQTYREVKEEKTPLERSRHDTWGIKPNLVPERLEAIADAILLERNRSCSLWLLCRVKSDAKAGRYRMQLRLTGDVSIPVEVEVLPFQLVDNGRIYGLWTNSLPGKDDDWRARQVRDLKEHGINTLFLDAYTVPVKVGEDGEPDLGRFSEALSWCEREGFNRKVLIYGLLNPLLRQVEAVSGSKDCSSEAWRRVARKVFVAIHELCESRGFKVYFHGVDEPDVHPKSMPFFESFVTALREFPGVRIGSNASPSGYFRFHSQIDFNICGDAFDSLINGTPQKNFFFKDWDAVDVDWMKKHIRYAYGQVRANDGLGARQRFGFLLDALGMEGYWGFSYHWGKSTMNVAWPYPESDGTTGTTQAWEALREGINDSRYYATLRKLKPDATLLLPSPAELNQMTAAELQGLRDRIIDQLTTDTKTNQ
ncbi:MAG: hypothetical protein GX561_05840 [Lentisphaerae bacterium]|jgi:hypothetical protein|nr:hypothetical protein [Lentisphaerota bacterium]